MLDTAENDTYTIYKRSLNLSEIYVILDDCSSDR